MSWRSPGPLRSEGGFVSRVKSVPPGGPWFPHHGSRVSKTRILSYPIGSSEPSDATSQRASKVASSSKRAVTVLPLVLNRT